VFATLIQSSGDLQSPAVSQPSRKLVLYIRVLRQVFSGDLSPLPASSLPWFSSTSGLSLGVIIRGY
jgi:hypothetical protein